MDGTVSGTTAKVNNQPRITAIDFSKATKTTGQTLPDPVVVTIAELNSDMSSYDGKLVKVEHAVTKGSLSSDIRSSVTIGQGSNTMTLYTQTATAGLSSGVYKDIIGFPTLYNSTKEIILTDAAKMTDASITWNLKSIAVKTAPTKIAYAVGDCFDPTGLVLSTQMEDADYDIITKAGSDVDYATYSGDFSFTPNLSTALTKSDVSITIGYGGKTVSQAITVGKATYAYTFTASDWSVTPTGCTWSGSLGGSSSNASGYDSTKGATIYKALNGLILTGSKSFSNITKVEIVYYSNGNTVGSFTVGVGSKSTASQSVSKNQTAKKLTFSTGIAGESGQVAITIGCTTSTLWLKSVTVYADAE